MGHEVQPRQLLTLIQASTLAAAAAVYGAFTARTAGKQWHTCFKSWILCHCSMLSMHCFSTRCVTKPCIPKNPESEFYKETECSTVITLFLVFSPGQFSLEDGV